MESLALQTLHEQELLALLRGRAGDELGALSALACEQDGMPELAARLKALGFSKLGERARIAQLLREAGACAANVAAAANDSVDRLSRTCAEDARPSPQSPPLNLLGGSLCRSAERPRLFRIDADFVTCTQ